MAKLVSKTYGDALFEVAVESGKMDELREEVTVMADLLRTDDEFVKLMNHPQIVKEEKLKVIDTCFSHRLSDELVGFIRLIVQKDRFGQIEEIFDYFIGRVKEYMNIGTAIVTSALELNPSQKEAVEQKLLATTKYTKFDIIYHVDKELIGGMVIRIGDRVVDSSVRTKLHELTKELSKIQLKAGECAP